MAEKRKTVPLFVINVVLFMFLAVVLVSAIFGYNSKINDITIGDNRYLTTEWHLLQELKARTDEELREKDREISLLRDEYEKLVRDGISEETKRELEAELANAERERERILSQRLLEPVAERSSGGPSDAKSSGAKGPAPARNPSPGESRSGESGSGEPGNGGKATGTREDSIVADDGSTALTALLGERISALEAQSAAYRLRADSAERRLAASEARQSTQDAVEQLAAASASALDADTAGNDARDLELLRTLFEERLNGFEDMPGPSIEDLKTRSLLRAIVSAPAVKGEYPDLLEAMDRYFAAFGKQEWIDGQKDAYTYALESVDAVQAK